MIEKIPNFEEKSTFESGATSPIQPESLARLDTWREGIAGEGVVIEWFNPVVEALDRMKILVTSGGIYWTLSEEVPPPYEGTRSIAVQDAVGTIDQYGFIFGGEELAQMAFMQSHYNISSQSPACQVRRVE